MQRACEGVGLGMRRAPFGGAKGTRAQCSRRPDALIKSYLNVRILAWRVGEFAGGIASPAWTQRPGRRSV